MSLATVYSCACSGLDAPLVRVEVHLSPGLPGLAVVGLPETAVRESKDRVRSAILNSGYEFPSQRVTINLSPADLPKEGGRFDLPIALGILAATGAIPEQSLKTIICIGELSLSGQLMPISGALSASLMASKAGASLVLPTANGNEAALPACTEVLTADTLTQVVQHCQGHHKLSTHNLSISTDTSNNPALDLAQVQGQFQAKRALEIAAAGGHSLLFLGPPGAGKSMLAARLPSILPNLTLSQQVEVAAIHSLHQPLHALTGTAPFRAPHHSASTAALVGGGQHGKTKPGEISLAHHGVLFLDELPEFNRQALEALREPLEAGHICLARAHQQVTFPASFQLVAAMNPCPCGYAGMSNNRCRCTPERIQHYLTRISGPLLDRIDIRLSLQPVELDQLQQGHHGETSVVVAARVAAARAIQYQRQGQLNTGLTGDRLVLNLSAKTKSRLLTACKRLEISARGYHRILRVARTIADLSQAPNIEEPHINEALSLRGQH
ncbi:MAG: YifB family Mg chelatase-like AAA ATPase [Moraxellaceae bacterium]|nr:YifB family Mg chelatase-like AAA ATPase [Moraxellaceae bacterium]